MSAEASPAEPPAAAVEVPMPKLSESMQDGTVLSWLRGAGEWVGVGDDLVEIETDKATMTYAAEAEGYLEIAAGEGETLEIGATIARLGPTPPPADPASAPVEGEEEEAVLDGGAPGEGDEPNAGRVAANTAAGSERRVQASPLARRLASRNEIDLDEVAGSGPSGRITRADVEALLSPTGAPPPPAGPRPAAGSTADHREEPAADPWYEESTLMERSVAERMTQSKTTAPDFGLLIDADMTVALELRADLEREAGEEEVPSLNDLVIKAAARALVEFPRANGSFDEGRFEMHERINVGFAVAVHRGLLVPTIADADRKTLGQVAAESRRLAERARGGTIEASELSGGTFTVSNLGMYGMRAILPVINPPEAAILGVGALEQRVTVVENEPAIRPLITLSLICDHRILYGAEAARFLLRVRACLEQPLRLTL